MMASSRAVVPRNWSAAGHSGGERRASRRGPSAPSGPITSYTPPKQVLLGVVIGIEGPDSPEGANGVSTLLWRGCARLFARAEKRARATPGSAPLPPPRLPRPGLLGARQCDFRRPGHPYPQGPAAESHLARSGPRHRKHRVFPRPTEIQSVAFWAVSTA